MTMTTLDTTVSIFGANIIQDLPTKIKKLKSQLPAITKATEQIIGENEKAMREVGLFKTKTREIINKVNERASEYTLIEQLGTTVKDLEKKLNRYDQSYIKYFHELLAIFGIKTKAFKLSENREEIKSSTDILHKYFPKEPPKKDQTPVAPKSLEEIKSDREKLQKMMGNNETKKKIPSTSNLNIHTERSEAQKQNMNQS